MLPERVVSQVRNAHPLGPSTRGNRRRRALPLSAVDVHPEKDADQAVGSTTGSLEALHTSGRLSSRLHLHEDDGLLEEGGSERATAPQINCRSESDEPGVASAPD
uniref:Uncharacterized protein n=1 Tax=Steinernema glaseri TaxID=37863 RepID=A0A1I7YW29_9BILA